MKKKEIKTELAPKAIGPYSQGILYNDLVFVSGQIPINPQTSLIEFKDIKNQTKQVLNNINEILKTQNLNFSNILRCEIFLKDLNDFNTVNETYETYFKDVEVKPSRLCVEVSKLPKDSLIEISCIAFKNK